MKYEILIKMLFFLLRVKKCTVSDLAVKFELSPRTILRYLDTLELGGIPIIRYAGKNGGIELDPSFKFERAFFTKKEFDTLIKSLEAFKGVSFEDTSFLIDKLSGLNKDYSLTLKNTEFYIDSESFINNNFFKEKINDIILSIKNRNIIEISYHNRNGELSVRKIEPHTLILKNGIFYLYAYCLLKNDFRLFKAGRIKEYNTTNETFERKDIKEIDLKIKDTAKLVNLELEIDKGIFNEVAEWISIENIEKTDDKILVKALVPFDDALINTILSFGDKIRIITPVEMIDILKQKCERTLKLYKK